MVADTHALLWYLLDPELLSPVARDAFNAPSDVAPVTTEVIRRITSIDRSHVRDPFDRAIVATAQAAGTRLITKDRWLTEHFAGLCLW